MHPLTTRWKALTTLLFAASSLTVALCVSHAEPLRNLRSVSTLSQSAACQTPQATFEGVVTHAIPARGELFLQQNGWALYIEDPSKTLVEAGDRLRITGTVACAARPYLRASRIDHLGHSPVPAPIPASFDDLIQGRRDDVLVRIRALVRSADLHADRRGATLHLQTDGGIADAVIFNTDDHLLNSLLDASIELTGIASAHRDGKGQRTGVLLYVGSIANIHILQKTSTDPWLLPATPMESIMSAYHVHNLSHRIRIHGVVTYIEPGQAAVLQDGDRSLWINTDNLNSLKIGDLADAVGFPRVVNATLQLAQAEIRSTGTNAAVAPAAFGWSALSSGKHLYDLVSTEGTVVMQVGGPSQDEYILSADGYVFSAIYRHPSGTASPSLEPLRKLPLGARIRVSGICIQDVADPGNTRIPFNLLLRSPADIQILRGPSRLTVRNMVLSVLFLALLLVAVSARFWNVERKVRREMATVAYSERRRSRILEQINSATPLAEIVEQAAELVSFRLKGAPCWVQITGGACLGSKPADSDGLRIRSLSIPAHSGPPLGLVSAAFDPHATYKLSEGEALSMAAGLIALAIETRKAYSDLVRRSEVDLLTDVQNRFSFERRVDTQIKFARQSASIFGIIYIDLNGFKQVNDLYGHRVGDLYLQEVSQRMKRQLRPSDVLARLGGDEFAVLVCEVGSETQVDEIALRLEHCFVEPIQVAECTVQGSAALGVALYPQDAHTRDSLIGVADSAMYEVKNARYHRNHTSMKIS
ncbi:MAG: GGDEF domain-containing protein [Terracidiphilus sp.]|nr:GGDEF domain-containing protein [Terracidiphilus sp.]